MGRSVTVAEVQEFQIYTQFEDGTEHQMEYGFGSGPLDAFGGAIDDGIDRELRTAVAQLGPAPIVATIDADIRDHLDLHEWRLAVIQIAVLFEAWLADYLRARLSAKGFDAAAIKGMFLKPNGQPKSATALASRLVLEATGFDFGSTPEFVAWTSAVRDPRNELVHGNRFDVAEREAEAANDAVANAVALLSSK